MSNFACSFFPEAASTPTFKVEEFTGKPAGGGVQAQIINLGTASTCGMIQAQAHRTSSMWEDTSAGSQIFQSQTRLADMKMGTSKVHSSRTWQAQARVGNRYMFTNLANVRTIHVSNSQFALHPRFETSCVKKSEQPSLHSSF